MAKRIKRFQVLNSQIFTVLNKYRQKTKDGQILNPSVEVEHVRCYHPPIHKTITTSPPALDQPADNGPFAEGEDVGVSSSPLYEELKFQDVQEKDVNPQDENHDNNNDSLSILFENETKSEWQKHDEEEGSKNVSPAAEVSSLHYV